ncbi:hypothetical protein NPIL_314351 [Nephila pilipes]|uniref:Uncharacterized protein n=1 Tax=Nephila pilipes TaxID=299642 RepID=A0A8X6PHA4_NEPPI|nr:hypothetical protein NPIL_314351 [Nephila pilipes]
MRVSRRTPVDYSKGERGGDLPSATGCEHRKRSLDGVTDEGRSGLRQTSWKIAFEGWEKHNLGKLSRLGNSRSIGCRLFLKRT